MNQGYRKYRPFQPIALADRTWPGRTLTQAPVWCSVDLRDGNQALVTPMNLEQKVAFFRIESAAKGLGLALAQAVRRSDDRMPSTKGSLD